MRIGRRAALSLGVGISAATAAVVVIAMQIAPDSGPTTQTATPRPTPVLAITPRPSPSPSSSPSPTVRPSPTLAQAPILTERFTLLVLGTDMNAIRRAAGDRPRTDAIMVVTVDAQQEEVAFFSLPRDAVDIPLPSGETWTGKVNEIYYANGPQFMRAAMETLLGLRIDRYVVVDMDQLAVAVDALGGVTIDVDAPLADPSVGFFLDAGPQTLDGATALRFARHRLQGTDYGRAVRHQQLFAALAQRVVQDPTPVGLSSVIGMAAQIDTDIPTEELPALLELAWRSRDARVSSTVFSPPTFATFEGIAGSRGWIMVPDVAAIREHIDELTMP